MTNIQTTPLINFLCDEQWNDLVQYISGDGSWPMSPTQFRPRLDTLRLIVEEHLPAVIHANRDSNGDVAVMSHRHVLDLLLHNTKYMYINPRTLSGDTIAEVFDQVKNYHTEGCESLYELVTSQSTLIRLYNMKLPKENHDACELLRHSLRKIPLIIVWTNHESELMLRIKCVGAYNVLNGR